MGDEYQLGVVGLPDDVCLPRDGKTVILSERQAGLTTLLGAIRVAWKEDIVIGTAHRFHYEEANGVSRWERSSNGTWDSIVRALHGVDVGMVVLDRVPFEVITRINDGTNHDITWVLGVSGVNRNVVFRGENVFNLYVEEGHRCLRTKEGQVFHLRLESLRLNACLAPPPTDRTCYDMLDDDL